jgi:hypothetical protein
MAQVKDLYSGTTGDAIGVAGGGTGQTSYTNGQLLIGNTTGNTLTKATLTAGTGVSITNGTGSITIAATGVGDVVGPASSTDNAFARFDSTTGKLLQNSTGATLSDTGAAVFTGALDVLGNSTAGSNIKLYEDTDNGSNYVAFKAPDTIAANVTWTLPSADGTSAQVLSTNGSGTLSWATASGGSSQWTTSGSNIYYSTGKVGIGTSTIASQLDVRNGATNATGINTNANQISITHNSNTGVGGQAEPAGFVVIRDKASAVSSGEFLGGLSWNARYTDTEDRAGYASILAVATGSGTADLTFNTSSSNITTAERLRLNGNGALILSGGTATADGVGITFPATQSASSNANTLDDYEEGTWTPSVGGTATYTFQVGQYTKIGNLVYINGFIQINAIGTGATTTITGLPFTPSNPAGSDASISIGYFASGATSVNWIGGSIDANAINIYSTTSTTTTAGGSAFFQASTRLDFSCCYRV